MTLVPVEFFLRVFKLILKQPSLERHCNAFVEKIWFLLNTVAFLGCEYIYILNFICQAWIPPNYTPFILWIGCHSCTFRFFNLLFRNIQIPTLSPHRLGATHSFLQLGLMFCWSSIVIDEFSEIISQFEKSSHGLCILGLFDVPVPKRISLMSENKNTYPSWSKWCCQFGL